MALTKTYTKAHTEGSLRFDSAGMIPVTSTTIANTVANTAVTQIVPLPCNVKIYGCAASFLGSPVGPISINFVAGATVESGLGTANTVATNGTQMFTADVPLTIQTNGVQQIQAPVPDVIWPETLPLTLRVVGVKNSAGHLVINLLDKAWDQTPEKPLYNASTGNLQV